MVDFLVDGWFQDSDDKNFIKKEDPVNGLLLFSELALLLKVHVTDLSRNGCNSFKLQAKRIIRHER